MTLKAQANQQPTVPFFRGEREGAGLRGLSLFPELRRDLPPCPGVFSPTPYSSSGGGDVHEILDDSLVRDASPWEIPQGGCSIRLAVVTLSWAGRAFIFGTERTLGRSGGFFAALDDEDEEEDEDDDLDDDDLDEDDVEDLEEEDDEDFEDDAGLDDEDEELDDDLDDDDDEEEEE